MTEQLTLYEENGTLYAGSIGETTPVSWQGDDGLSFEEWEAIGRTLQQVGASLNWWVGDWLNYGERKWGEMYAQAIEVTGWEYERLRKAKWVASSVKLCNRLHNLSWTHHHEVASLQPDDQSKWLARAESERLSVRELRDAIRASRQPAQLPPTIPHTNGHTLPDDDGDDVPFSFGRNGDSHEGEPDGVSYKKWESTTSLYDSDSLESQKNPRPHVANNSGNNEWYTPEQFTQAARDVMGEITLDPASSELANTKVRAAHIYTADDDGLSMPWFGKVWLNPPYAAGLVDKFASKLVEEYESGEVDEAIVLVNNATETGWFASLVSIASAVCFPTQRIKYWSPAGELNTPLQGQAIVYVGANAGGFVDRFSPVGWCAWVA